MRTRIDRDAVVAALTAEAVMARFGIKFRVSGSELRTNHCPACGPRSGPSVYVRMPAGPWFDHTHGCKGDLLDMCAGYAGVDVRRDFLCVLDLAADIAGLAANTPTTTAARHRHADQHDAGQVREAAARNEAIRRLPAEWEGLRRRSTDGEAYLRHRGLDVGLLLDRDVVRFDHRDDVVVRLADLEDGSLVNLVTRRRDREPKVMVHRGCPIRGTLGGKLSDISEGVDVVVVPEGVMDTLAAICEWPTCLVLGAHSAGQLGYLGAACAPRVAAVRGWMLGVPHRDAGAGEAGMVDVCMAAITAGLVLDRSLLLVDVSPEKDLAEARQKGWSWTWPS